MIIFDRNGDDSIAVKFSDDLIEIRKDLLVKFCAVKQMAMVFFVDCFRFGSKTLEELAQNEIRESKKGKNFYYDHIFINYNDFLNKGYKTMSRVVGKKIILPKLFPKEEVEVKNFQSFTIGSDDEGNDIKMSCGQLSNGAEYLTPVFFKREVLNKYYSDKKYSIQDGNLWYGNLWNISIDNDHDDYVVVYLGDLGRDLQEKERNHWLGYNIPPHGRTISQSEFERSFMANWFDSTCVELVFKRKYPAFNEAFFKRYQWHFFLPMHEDDVHCLNSLCLPENSINEFEKVSGYLVKILIDSLNEEKIFEIVKDRNKNEKGITKLQKYFLELKFEDYQEHIKFLRNMQEIRSKGIAHRKGSDYQKIKTELNLHDENYKQMFKEFLEKAICFIDYLSERFLVEDSEIIPLLSSTTYPPHEPENT